MRQVGLDRESACRRFDSVPGHFVGQQLTGLHAIGRESMSRDLSRDCSGARWPFLNQQELHCVTRECGEAPGWP